MLAADAVQVEPVSPTKFPANREKNREFNKIGASGAAEIVNNAVVTGLPVPIPYSAEQGIILADQGIFALEQGFFRPELKSSPNEILVTKSLWVMFAPQKRTFTAQLGLSEVRQPQRSPRPPTGSAD